MIYKLIIKTFILLIAIGLAATTLEAQQTTSAVKLARVKYSGGGDWYNDPTAEENLLNYVKRNTNINVDAKYEFVDLGSDNLFSYPMLFLTGHGNVNFSMGEIRNLRAYLENGGFLYIDDDYGLDKYIREEMKKVFPDNDFREIPFSHNLFHSHFDLRSGAPKIHEHDDKAPKTFGIFIDKRLAVVYTVESNPSDGWVEPEIHDNPPEKREQAFKFGTNLIVFALSN